LKFNQSGRECFETELELRTLVQRLRASPISNIVNDRLRSFSAMQSKGFEEWFSELCFCILVANSPARKVYRVMQSTDAEALINLSENELRKRLKTLGVRFHNRAGFIVQARRTTDLKERVLSFATPFKARYWLVENFKGIGYKEASHFLRNVGFFDLAILDRHIISVLRSMDRVGLPGTPKSPKQYLELERFYLDLSTSLGTRPGELDLYLWYVRTGDIVK